jgi:hypothetical protein
MPEINLFQLDLSSQQTFLSVYMVVHIEFASLRGTNNMNLEVMYSKVATQMTIFTDVLLTR